MEPLEDEIVARLRAVDWEGATTVALRGYGPQIFAYLRGVFRDDDLAGEVFSIFAEKMWGSIQTFRGESSFRSWAFGIAWHAAKNYKRSISRRREVRLTTSALSRVTQEVRTTTHHRYDTRTRDHWAHIKEVLTEEERSLLLLRLERNLPWAEVAVVMAEQGDPAPEATLRKRFERLRKKVRGLLQKQRRTR